MNRTPLIQTILICATVWAVASEILVFDYLKFDARRSIMEEAARNLSKIRQGMPVPSILEKL